MPPTPSSSEFVSRPDGAQIHYQIHGSGEPAAVLCDGLGCDGFAWKYLLPQVSAKAKAVRWHYRGHGRSGLPHDLQKLGMDENCDDLLAVLDAAGLDKAVLFGHSMGVQVALELHRRHPERVAGLVLICGSYGRPLDTFHDTNLLKTALPYLSRVVEAFPSAVRWVNQLAMGTDLVMEYAFLVEVNRQLLRRADLQPYFNHLAQMDPVIFVRMLKALSDHSALDHLPSVDVPTLIVGGEKDTFTPAWLSHQMADAIPGASLLMVEGGTHTTPLETPDEVWAAVERFLGERIEKPRPARKATVKKAVDAAG